MQTKLNMLSVYFRYSFLFKLLFFFSFVGAKAQRETAYQRPPEKISVLIEKKGPPVCFFEERGNWILLAATRPLKTIHEMAHPQMQIGGLHFFTTNFSQVTERVFYKLELRDRHTGKTCHIQGLPANLRASNIEWNPDGTKIAFTQLGPDGVDLYVINLHTITAKRMNASPLNLVMPGCRPYQFLPGNRLVYKVITQPCAKVPQPSRVPLGPAVEETRGEHNRDLLYRNLLKNAYDEKVFDFYTSAQLVINKDGKEIKVGEPSVYYNFQVSPDGNYILIHTLQKPYPSTVKYRFFSQQLSILNEQGKRLRIIADLPAKGTGDPLKVNFSLIQWRTDQPATLSWVQISEIKNNQPDVSVYNLPAPFHAALCKIFTTKNKVYKIVWYDSSTAFSIERTENNLEIISRIDPIKKTVKELYRQEMHGAARLGEPLAISKNGVEVAAVINDSRIILNNQKTLLLYDFHAQRIVDTIWQRKDKTVLEKVLLKSGGPFIITKMENEDGFTLLEQEPGAARPKVFVHQAAANQPPLFVQSQTVNYRRSDGILLSGQLFLPENYDKEKDGQLPVLLWGYPTRVDPDKVAVSAADGLKRLQLSSVNFESFEVWASMGFAVFNSSMPIINGKSNGNDSYLQQLVLNAEAAIDFLDQSGIGDKNRVAVIGHSYGGEMVANLLAHSHLFKAGIALSGGYNRIHAPFGYQDEKRTFWEAADSYDKASAIRYADRIKAPLLVVHGDRDEVAGTPVTESKDLFNAIRGNGGIARLVILPYEGHVYQAAENIMHLFAEEWDWLNNYVK